MFYTIYKITNKINGKIYIGKHQTKNLKDSYMGSGTLLNHAIEKYGISNFDKEIVYIFDTKFEMNSKEAELVTEEFCARNDTYNICVGGKGGFSYINSNGLRSPRASSMGGYSRRNYTSKQFKEYHSSESWKLNRISKIIERHGKEAFSTFLGKKHSDESKNKMRLSKIGKNCGKENSQFGTQWITDGIVNKKIKRIDNIPDGWYKGRTAPMV